MWKLSTIVFTAAIALAPLITAEAEVLNWGAKAARVLAKASKGAAAAKSVREKLCRSVVMAGFPKDAPSVPRVMERVPL